MSDAAKQRSIRMRLDTHAADTLDSVRWNRAGQGAWRDEPQNVAAFAIDKRPVSCADYQVCVDRKACRGGLPNSCDRNRAHVTVEQAISYCQWRGGKLPTLQQWQAAVRGPTGKESAPCDNPNAAVDDECTITNDAGVTTSTGWDASELTRTQACSPAEYGQGAGLHQLRVAPLRFELNVFVPFDPKDPYPKWMGFRCSHSEVAGTTRATSTRRFNAGCPCICGLSSRISTSVHGCGGRCLPRRRQSTAT